MIKNSKRKKIFKFSLLISIIVFITTFFILLNFIILKKHSKTNFILKNTNLKIDKNISCINTPNNIANIYSDYNWRIEIPKIKINAPILEGTDSTILRKAVGHFEGTGIDSSNICLAAHNRGYKYNFFQEIKNLNVDDIIYYFENGNKLTFNVVSNKVIKEYDLSDLKNTKETRLTLITCEENKKEYRRCIIAKKIL